MRTEEFTRTEAASLRTSMHEQELPAYLDVEVGGDRTDYLSSPLNRPKTTYYLNGITKLEEHPAPQSTGVRVQNNLVRNASTRYIEDDIRQQKQRLNTYGKKDLWMDSEVGWNRQTTKPIDEHRITDLIVDAYLHQRSQDHKRRSKQMTSESPTPSPQSIPHSDPKHHPMRNPPTTPATRNDGRSSTEPSDRNREMTRRKKMEEYKYHQLVTDRFQDILAEAKEGRFDVAPIHHIANGIKFDMEMDEPNEDFSDQIYEVLSDEMVSSMIKENVEKRLKWMKL
ncbi:hypothetical protein PROFUN_11863 [Planoprotostelium fungivorum]|uniref:Uncharacterized protein n=1 Tax=Planoprotostelium fungivorum TaxID=1890364 RepID=A0A2P6N9D7_9EUKA|nr:hypothetical protein PROFUN_11863 [Planoprotostelium fungivorum]